MFFKFEGKVFDELSCVDRFDESSIRGAFAGGVVAVGGVEEDEHGCVGDSSGIPGRR